MLFAARVRWEGNVLTLTDVCLSVHGGKGGGTPCPFLGRGYLSPVTGPIKSLVLGPVQRGWGTLA